jgi:hypothetical protein
MGVALLADPEKACLLVSRKTALRLRKYGRIPANTVSHMLITTPVIGLIMDIDVT